MADAEQFTILENIISLRNKTPPAHKFSSVDVPPIMKQMGLLYTVDAKADWQKHWDTIVLKYTGAIRKIRSNLLKSLT